MRCCREASYLVREKVSITGLRQDCGSTLRQLICDNRNPLVDKDLGGSIRVRVVCDAITGHQAVSSLFTATPRSIPPLTHPSTVQYGSILSNLLLAIVIPAEAGVQEGTINKCTKKCCHSRGSGNLGGNHERETTECLACPPGPFDGRAFHGPPFLAKRDTRGLLFMGPGEKPCVTAECLPRFSRSEIHGACPGMAGCTKTR